MPLTPKPVSESGIINLFCTFIVTNYLFYAKNFTPAYRSCYAVGAV